MPGKAAAEVEVTFRTEYLTNAPGRQVAEMPGGGHSARFEVSMPRARL